MVGKKLAPQSITGQLGANLIERFVLEMKYIWRPMLVFDLGIDGEIEICDPTTGEATNAVIKVQAKATTQPFQAETPDSFEFTCDQKDLDYWLRGNAPVILIVCRPETNEAYWASLRDYFKDLAIQKSRKVVFDKKRDCFDTKSARSLLNLAVPKDSGVYFAPLQKSERLYSNLLKVVSFASKIYVAETDYRNPKQLWAKFRDLGAKTGSEWILANRRILSFRNLEEYPFNTICELGTLEDFHASEWADSDDEDKKREFVRLLNMSLEQRVRIQGLRSYKNKKGDQEYFYFPAMKGLKTRSVNYQNIERMTSREVFKEYKKKIDFSQRAYCRHSAFRGYFIRLDGSWYLEITPTYHFTSDGYKEGLFRKEHLSGIKRLERNPAVLGHLMMWADYLSRPTKDLFFPEEYPFLTFSKLATVDIDIGLPDKIWYNAEEGEEAESMRAPDNQLTWGDL